MGEYEKAKALANNQNTLVISKEVLLPLATVGDEKARYQGERIMALLSNLRLAISESVATRPAVSSSVYGRQILLSVINLFETVFVDGRCGAWHQNIGQLYLTLAKYAMDNNDSMENILNYFDKGFEHYKEYTRICIEGDYQYSAPLMSALPKINKGDLMKKIAILLCFIMLFLNLTSCGFLDGMIGYGDVGVQPDDEQGTAGGDVQGD